MTPENLFSKSRGRFFWKNRGRTKIIQRLSYLKLSKFLLLQDWKKIWKSGVELKTEKNYGNRSSYWYKLKLSKFISKFLLDNFSLYQ
jgi:hypothetical protein